MTSTGRHIGVVGAGLVGSLVSIYLARRGYRVSVFERRDDLRVSAAEEGRSINLALSTRGIRALEKVGLAAEISSLAIPMHGRLMHDRRGGLNFLPYGREGQYINSVSRRHLNALLIERAESHGVRFFFNHRCIGADVDHGRAAFLRRDGTEVVETFDQLIGADGAFSSVRGSMQTRDRYNYAQDYLAHGYKELRIPPAAAAGFVMERNALHIWPREQFMMIALPNPDGSFTCTLFLPFEGPQSFAALGDEGDVKRFFEREFPDVLAYMPDLKTDYRQNPVGSLVTIKCFPWMINNTVLIGDAAHAIVPFYGQGMNAGFEDCRILDQLLDEHGDEWGPALQAFQETRKEDADAIAALAFDNFIEMRDLVGTPDFLLRKKIEARLHELYPAKWIPLYSMVTFNDSIRYSQAHRTGMKQRAIMDDVMKTPDIGKNWESLDFRRIVERLG